MKGKPWNPSCSLKEFQIQFNRLRSNEPHFFMMNAVHKSIPAQRTQRKRRGNEYNSWSIRNFFFGCLTLWGCWSPAGIIGCAQENHSGQGEEQRSVHPPEKKLMEISATDSQPAAKKILFPEELLVQLQLEEKPMVLDVRTPYEYAQGHIPGAINIPHYNLSQKLNDIIENALTGPGKEELIRKLREMKPPKITGKVELESEKKITAPPELAKKDGEYKK